jgi:hypothetical protein
MILVMWKSSVRVVSQLPAFKFNRRASSEDFDLDEDFAVLVDSGQYNGLKCFKRPSRIIDQAQRPPPETPGRLQQSLPNYPNRPTAQRGGGSLQRSG